MSLRLDGCAGGRTLASFRLDGDVSPESDVPLLHLGGEVSEIWCDSETPGALSLRHHCLPRVEHWESDCARLYARAYAETAADGYRHVLRTWNFIRDINAGTGDAETYKRFCTGRARGLRGRSDHPAATAIGSHAPAPALVVSLLASKTPGLPVENPRQVSAFRYPRRYGPTRPGFSRGLVVPDAKLLLASGTASITGHETRWAGDPVAQIGECVTNLRALLETAGGVFENPRQVSAFRYPRRYGPTRPGFSRGLVVPDAKLLLASGTASITGHETRWAGDPVAQIGECVTNLRALLETAGGVFGRSAPVLRVYVRHADDYPAVREALAPQLPDDAAVSYLHGDICRADLLVEIEGVFKLPDAWTPPPQVRASTRFGPLDY